MAVAPLPRGIHVAVNRREPRTTDERLGLSTALAACTAGSAHVNGLDGTGTLRPGNLAYLVVLDRDVFTHPPEGIAEGRVLPAYARRH